MLAKRIIWALRRNGDRAAVADRTGTLSYSELYRRGMEIAEALEQWSKESLKGDGTRERLRIALYANNSIAYIEAYVGLVMAGAVPFLIDPSFGSSEVNYVINACSIDAIVHDKPLSTLLQAASAQTLGRLNISVAQYDARRRLPILPSTAVCRFTSGSTGSPNCLEFSGEAVCAAAEGWVNGTQLTGADRILCFAGLSNGLAFNTSLLPAFLSGAWVYFSSGLPTATTVIGLLGATRASRLTGFPALYESLARRCVSPQSISGLKLAISAGARLRPEVTEVLAEQCRLHISDYYGIAETGPLTFELEPGRHRGLGRPLPGVALRAAGPAEPPSEILARSPSMASRYLNMPGVFEKRLTTDGFYHSGDYGYLDEGRLVLVGRNMGAMNIGGRKVDPVEVGRVLADISGVDDALVFSVTKANGDEIVVALVASGTTLDPEHLRSACRQRLAPFKVPEQIYVVAGLPVNSVGKPRLEVARQMVNELSWSAVK